jgi:hypothetical protein
MEDAGENRPFQGEFEFPALRQFITRPVNPQFPPQPAEEQGRTEPAVGEGCGFLPADFAKERYLRGKALHGEHKRIKRARLLEQVEAPQIGDDVLDYSPVQPVVFDDLQIGAVAAGFGPDEHGRLLVYDITIYRRQSLKVKEYLVKTYKTWHYVFTVFEKPSKLTITFPTGYKFCHQKNPSQL